MTSIVGRAFADAPAARRSFLLAFLVLGALRAWFAAVLPFTSDEAYFLYWGRHPAWGFYDHPPMIGWWLAVLDTISDARFVLRLPALVAPTLVAAIGWRMLRRHGETLAWSGATLLLLVPLNAWNVAVTTDVPLMLFSALTVALYLRARESGRALDFLLAGLALAGALMSKYFAGLLALAILAHSLRHPTRASLAGLAWIVVGALPAAVVQIAWNAQHCWPNVMFNLVNRNEDAGFSWRTPLLYVVSVLYVLTPAVALRLAGVTGRRRAPGRGVQAAAAGPSAAGAATGAPAGAPVAASAAPPAGADERAALRWLAVVPLALFAALSLVKTIGLHWLASFVLPAVVWFALSVDVRSLRRAIAVAAWIALAHWAAIAVLASLPTETFRWWKGYPGLVMTAHGDELARALEPYRATHAIASDSYSPAVTIGYNLGQYVLVFGTGSSHARHDDILTDFRTLDGRDILIVQRKEVEPDQYEPYFDRVQYRDIEIRGAVFHLVDGRGFRYPAYRDRVLEEIRRRYYQVPRWLPAGPCYFCDRYFPDRACHR